MIRSTVFFSIHPKEISKEDSLYLSFRIENNLITNVKQNSNYNPRAKLQDVSFSMDCNSEYLELFEQYDFKYIYRNNKFTKTKIIPSRLTKLDKKEYRFENRIKNSNIPVFQIESNKKYFKSLIPLIEQYSAGTLSSNQLLEQIKSTLISEFSFSNQ